MCHKKFEKSSFYYIPWFLPPARIMEKLKILTLIVLGEGTFFSLKVGGISKMGRGNVIMGNIENVLYAHQNILAELDVSNKFTDNHNSLEFCYVQSRSSNINMHKICKFENMGDLE